MYTKLSRVVEIFSVYEIKDDEYRRTYQMH